ncbi:MAG: hypothetical protein ACI4QR_04290 [Eubacteriales bacterium]
MIMTVEEKKYTLSSHGTTVARGSILVPVFHGKEKINAFYLAFSEKLYSFMEKSAEEYKTEFESMDRAARRGFEPMSVRLFSSIAYADVKIISITQEYVVSVGQRIFMYRKLCQSWDAEKEILVRPERFLSGKAIRYAKRNEFYLSGNEVTVVRNTFPDVSGDKTGRRISLSDYTEDTRFRIKGGGGEYRIKRRKNEKK